MNVKGFKVNFLGDSITEGVGVTDIKNCRYDNRLKDLCELSAVNNYGIGGTRIAHQPKASENPRYDLNFCGRAYNMDESADMVVVYGGVNDYIHGGAPFGQMGDTTPDTFCGGVYYLMNFLKKEYEGKTVVFMTPARLCRYGQLTDLKPSPRDTKLPDAKPLLDYVNVIIETGKQLGLPVLSLYHKMPINPNIPEDCEKYTVDGLHFNDDGHAVLAKTLADFIAEL